MPLVVIGINHRTAPVEVRERVVFAGEQLPLALRALVRVEGVSEAVIISTCNRTELYCLTSNGLTSSGQKPLVQWLVHWHDLAAHEQDIESCLYQLQGTAAIKHIFSVACGLDSLVLGEPQILGQLKDAYRAALDQAVTGPYLNRLLQTAFSVAKRVRTQTRIGANAVSVASAAVQHARTVFEDFAEHTALLVGAGETIELAARHLHAHGLRRMIVANRSLDRAQLLAREFNAYAVTLDALNSHLAEADIVISSTASPTPIITYQAVRNAMRVRRNKQIYMVDIAVPRDIDPEVAKLDNIYLFTIDDLQNVIKENLESRREAAEDAHQMIANEIIQFEQNLKTLDAVPTIRQLRADAQAIRVQTLEQAQRMLAAGRGPQEVLDFLATTLTNRLMHAPSQRLREAAERGDADLIEAAKALFGTDAGKLQRASQPIQLDTPP